MLLSPSVTFLLIWQLLYVHTPREVSNVFFFKPALAYFLMISLTTSFVKTAVYGLDVYVGVYVLKFLVFFHFVIKSSASKDAVSTDINKQNKTRKS